MNEFEPRTELEKEELGLYQEQKESNLDRLGKISCYIVILGLITAIIFQLNK
jgi:hypothetical protein